MVSEREMIKNKLDEIGKDLSPAERQLHEDALVKIFEANIPPAEAMGLSEGNLEAIYSRAYQLYQNGKFDEAAMIFRVLVNIEGRVPKYFIGLGACYQMMKRFDLAVWPYLVAHGLDEKSPLPLVYLSDCYTRLGFLQLALKFLDKAIELMKDDPLYASSLFKLTRMRESLEKENKENDKVKIGE